MQNKKQKGDSSKKQKPKQKQEVSHKARLFATMTSLIIYVYIGLDIGDSRTGIAICEGQPLIAIPKDTVDTAELLDYLKEITKNINREDLVLVVGLPLNMSGEETMQTFAVRAIAAQIEEYLDTQAYFIDERLTSVESMKLLQEAGVKQKEAKEHKDHLAAQIILQSYLDTNV